MNAPADFACPACGKENTDATCLSDPLAVPEPGAVLVCIGCAAPAVLDDAGVLRPAGREVVEDPDVQRAVYAVRRLHAELS